MQLSDRELVSIKRRPQVDLLWRNSEFIEVEVYALIDAAIVPRIAVVGKQRRIVARMPRPWPVKVISHHVEEINNWRQMRKVVLAPVTRFRWRRHGNLVARGRKYIPQRLHKEHVVSHLGRGLWNLPIDVNAVVGILENECLDVQCKARARLGTRGHFAECVRRSLNADQYHYPHLMGARNECSLNRMGRNLN